jgi:siroheme synthase-like protein
VRRYYPVALELAGERALVIGGSTEAADRARRLSAAGASVAVVSREGSPELVALALRSRVHWYARPFTPEDARGCRLVVLCERDAALAAALHANARRAGYLFSAVDQPEHCDFVHMATIAAGPVQIAVSTGGAAPALARRLREGLERGLDQRFARFAEEIAARRATLPAEERREGMAQALAGFELEISLRYPPPRGE